MGLNLSKRIEKTLSSTPAFTSACAASYAHSLDGAQHAFPGLRLYQLLPASLHLHSSLTRYSPTLPLLARWAPPEPTQASVDSAIRAIGFQGGGVLDEATFERFAVELFKELVVGEIVGRVVMRRVPVAVAAIAGVGMVMGGGGAQVVGKAIGVYAVAVAASVYLSLS